MCVGQRIKKHLAENGISQTFLSSKTGIPLSKLNLSLNGSRRLSFEEYELICGALKVGTDKFLKPKVLDDTLMQESG
jgi:transcriptional regulator with XRE-family HTH domain